MRFQPLADNEFVITPETETESFYINQFLRSWNSGLAGITIRGTIGGVKPCNELVLSMPAPFPKLKVAKTEKL